MRPPQPSTARPAIHRARLAVAASAGWVIVLGAVALAHPSFSPASVPRGESDLVLHLPDEAEGAFVENARVDLELVAGFAAVSGTPPDGWSCDTGGADGPVVFERGLRVGGDVQRFPIRLAVDAPPGEHRFPVTQTYSDGSGVYWAGGSGTASRRRS